MIAIEWTAGAMVKVLYRLSSYLTISKLSVLPLRKRQLPFDVTRIHNFDLNFEYPYRFHVSFIVYQN